MSTYKDSSSIPKVETNELPSISFRKSTSTLSIDVTDGIHCKGHFEDGSKDTQSIHPLFLAIKNGDMNGINSILKKNPELLNGIKHQGSYPIHYAIKARDSLALRELFKFGADVHIYDNLGRTALHIAVDEAWHKGIAELLSRGASPDIKSKPDKSVGKGMLLETPLHSAVKKGDFTSTNLLLDRAPNLEIRDSNQSTIIHLAAQGRNPKIMHILLKEKPCQDMMNMKDCKGNSVLHSALLHPCGSQSEYNLITIVNILLEFDADVKTVNCNGETLIYLAVLRRLPTLVQTLHTAGANPVKVTHQGYSVIHAACRSGCTRSLSYLLSINSVRSLVTEPDIDGNEPFYHAVHQSRSIDCCELLLNNGEHLTRKDKDGISRFELIQKHLPEANQLLKRLFDAHIHYSKEPKHDPEFCISFDYSIIFPPEDDGEKSLHVGDFIDPHLQSILLHPLLESYIFFRLHKLRTIIHGLIIWHFFHLMLYTVFLILTFGEISLNWCYENSTLQTYAYLHVSFCLIFLSPSLVSYRRDFKKYVCHSLNCLKFISLASSTYVIFYFVTSCKDFKRGPDNIPGTATGNTNFTNRTDESPFPSIQYFLTENANEFSIIVQFVGSVSAFCNWLLFSLYVGLLNVNDTYIYMFIYNAVCVAKCLSFLIPLIIGFSLSLSVLSPKSSTFSNPLLSIEKTFLMLLGEIDDENLSKLKGQDIEDLSKWYMFLIILAMLLVLIINTNMLTAVVIDNFSGLLTKAKISRLVEQARCITCGEKLMTIVCRFNCISSSLKNTLKNYFKIPHRQIFYPNHARAFCSGKPCLPLGIIEQAILVGNNEDSTKELANTAEIDEEQLPKSFENRYRHGRKDLKEKSIQVPDDIEDKLREHLNQVQEIMVNQLMMQLRNYDSHETSKIYFEKKGEQTYG